MLVLCGLWLTTWSWLRSMPVACLGNGRLSPEVMLTGFCYFFTVAGIVLGPFVVIAAWYQRPAAQQEYGLSP